MDKAPGEDWRFIAFLASAAAAGIHFGATRAHMHEYLPAGWFMLVAGLLQLAWATWVSRGAPSVVVAAGAAGNLGIVALWTVSRTAGLPWGEMPGMPEHIHRPDVRATALAILIVIAAARLLASEAPAAQSLLRLAWAGALAACIFGPHHAAHEQMAALATITTAFALRGLVTTLRASILHEERGSNEKVPYHIRILARRPADARAGLGARG